jgi:hypothetical protein
VYSAELKGDGHIAVWGVFDQQINDLSYEDCAFINHSWDDIRSLLDEVKERDDRIADLEKQLKKYKPPMIDPTKEEI